MKTVADKVGSGLYRVNDLIFCRNVGQIDGIANSSIPESISLVSYYTGDEKFNKFPALNLNDPVAARAQIIQDVASNSKYLFWRSSIISGLMRLDTVPPNLY
jgi:hypothetical protein